MGSRDQENITKIYLESFYGISNTNDHNQLANWQHPHAATPGLTFSKTANGPGAGKHTSVHGGPGYHSNEEDTAQPDLGVGDFLFGQMEWGKSGEIISGVFKIVKIEGSHVHLQIHTSNKFLQGEWLNEIETKKISKINDLIFRNKLKTYGAPSR